MMMRNPGFTVVAILALALGIGANTAIFTVVDGIVLKPLPFSDSSRLVYIWETTAADGFHLRRLSEFPRLAQAAKFFRNDVPRCRPESLILTGGRSAGTYSRLERIV